MFQVLFPCSVNCRTLLCQQGFQEEVVKSISVPLKSLTCGLCCSEPCPSGLPPVSEERRGVPRCREHNPVVSESDTHTEQLWCSRSPTGKLSSGTASHLTDTALDDHGAEARETGRHSLFVAALSKPLGSRLLGRLIVLMHLLFSKSLSTELSEKAVLD